jgi:hypothetical protein
MWGLAECLLDRSIAGTSRSARKRSSVSMAVRKLFTEQDQRDRPDTFVSGHAPESQRTLTASYATSEIARDGHVGLDSGVK